MSEFSSAWSGTNFLLGKTESLVECCNCRGPLSEPVMLSCLHNCCRSCAELGSVGQQVMQSSSSVKCSVCCEATEQSAVTPNGFLFNYKRLSVLASEKVYCQTCDAQDVAAAFWCSDCCLGVCESCYSWHNRFNSRHCSTGLQVARTWSVSQLTHAIKCSSHKRQMEVECFTCRGPKCLLCCEKCRAEKHDLQPIFHGKTRKHLSAVIEAIRANKERLSRTVSDLQQRCQDTKGRVEESRASVGSKTLVLHKRVLQDETVNEFDESVNEVSNNLQRKRQLFTTDIERRVSLSATVTMAAHITQVLTADSVERMQLLHERPLLKGIVKRCISVLAVSLRRQRKYRQNNSLLSIDGQLPLTSDIILRSCLGVTDLRRAAPPAPLLFGPVVVTFRTPVACYDIAITQDGHVLLAAGEHGLLEYSIRGQPLSSWKPDRLTDGREDDICCLAAMTDGRAAVAVEFAHLILLLRRCETGNTWLHDRLVAKLQSPGGRLSVHVDLLAVLESRRNEERQGWFCGRQVKLLRLSSRNLLYRQIRDYDIEGLAVTALCLVTCSFFPVESSSGRAPYVVDACSHSGEFLWRYETAENETLSSLCVSPDSWSQVYIAVVRKGTSSSRVVAISGADGRDRKDVLSSRTHGLDLVVYLSLARGQRRTLLAVLCYDYEAKQKRTVSVYEATGCKQASAQAN